MNISITNECNRRCEFCFQKEWYLSNDNVPKQEMTLENIEKLLAWVNKKTGIKIFGGEPLLYSNLQGLFDVFKDADRKLIFLTNFNVSSSQIDIVMKNIEDVKFLLINCDYNDYQKNQFEENIKRLPKDTKLRIGTTLLQDKKYVEQSIERILNTISILDRERVDIRVAPMTPNFKIKYDYKYDSGDNLIFFMDEILKNYPNTRFGFDCPINLCEIKQETIEKIKENYSNKVNFNLDCCYKDKPPTDVLVDNSVVWCSSSKFIKVDNIFDYDSPEELDKELKIRYNEFMQNNFEKTECINCEKFATLCDGLCASKIV